MEDIDLETYKKHKKYFLKTKPKEYYAEVYFYNGMHFYIKDKSITELINDEYQEEIVCFIRDINHPAILRGINNKQQIINNTIKCIAANDCRYDYENYYLSYVSNGCYHESLIFISFDELCKHVSEYKLSTNHDLKLDLTFDLQPINSYSYTPTGKGRDLIINHFCSKSELDKIKFNKFYSSHKKWFDYYNNLNDEDKLKLELTGKL